MLANNSILKLPLSMSISRPGGYSFHGPERAERRALQSHQLERGRQEELTKAADTCAIRWCCRFITRDTAICMLPNTATTSKILSSKEGAVNVCHIQGRENSAEAQLCWRFPLPPVGDDLGAGFQLCSLICIKLTTRLEGEDREWARREKQEAFNG